MKLPSNYDTSIDSLLERSNNDTLFLSSWDRDIKESDVPFNLIKKAIRISINDVNKYQYMDEMLETKEYIKNTILNEEKISISSQNIAVATNGTAGAFLILKTLSEHQHLSPLLLTPIYFSYISALNALCETIEYYQVLQNEKIVFDYEKIELLMREKHINLIVINDPLFCSGLPIENKVYKQLILLCEKYKATLLVDFLYGGMEWYGERHYTQTYLLKEISKGKSVFLIDSMPKRLFINGIKNAVIYGESSNIQNLEKLSVYTVGCMVYSQISLLKELYNPKNKSVINEIINQNVSTAVHNYTFIKSLLLDSNCYLNECSSGHFALCNIPYYLLEKDSNINIAKSILNRFNIITIPHDRYLYFDSSNYCFRVNLLHSKPSLALGINNIKNIG